MWGVVSGNLICSIFNTHPEFNHCSPLSLLSIPLAQENARLFSLRPLTSMATLMYLNTADSTIHLKTAPLLKSLQWLPFFSGVTSKRLHWPLGPLTICFLSPLQPHFPPPPLLPLLPHPGLPTVLWTQPASSPPRVFTLSDASARKALFRHPHSLSSHFFQICAQILPLQ